MLRFAFVEVMIYCRSPAVFQTYHPFLTCAAASVRNKAVYEDNVPQKGRSLAVRRPYSQQVSPRFTVVLSPSL